MKDRGALSGMLPQATARCRVIHPSWNARRLLFERLLHRAADTAATHQASPETTA